MKANLAPCIAFKFCDTISRIISSSRAACLSCNSDGKLGFLPKAMYTLQSIFYTKGSGNATSSGQFTSSITFVTSSPITPHYFNHPIITPTTFCSNSFNLYIQIFANPCLSNSTSLSTSIFFDSPKYFSLILKIFSTRISFFFNFLTVEALYIEARSIR